MNKLIGLIIMLVALVVASPAAAYISSDCDLSSDYGAPGQTWAFKVPQDSIKEDSLGQLWICRNGGWVYMAHVSEMTPAAAPDGRVWYRSGKRGPLGAYGSQWHPLSWTDETPGDRFWEVVKVSISFRVVVETIVEPIAQHDHETHGCGVDGG